MRRTWPALSRGGTLEGAARSAGPRSSPARSYCPRVHGSCLNLVERWFAILSERRIKRASHRSTRELERDIREFVRHTNQDPRPFIWTKSADRILASVRRFCQYTLETQGVNWRTSDSGH